MKDGEAAMRLQESLELSGTKVQRSTSNAMEDENLLRNACLVVILGTQSYAADENCYTSHQLNFILAQKKPMFLLKMCDSFQNESAFNQNQLRGAVSWDRRTDIAVPSHAAIAIHGKLDRLRQADDTVDDVSRPDDTMESGIYEPTVSQNATDLYECRMSKIPKEKKKTSCLLVHVIATIFLPGFASFSLSFVRSLIGFDTAK
eukprot:m.5823 g.5823  ORF g.5823 m.5823 type:complete len:203 (+) comp4417_c0_seq1:236-844(+)